MVETSSIATVSHATLKVRLKRWCDVGKPRRIGRATFPSVSGSRMRVLTSSLSALGLSDGGGRVTALLGELARAWRAGDDSRAAEAVLTVLNRYAPIGTVDWPSVRLAELEERFRSKFPEATTSDRRKAVALYTALAAEAGCTTITAAPTEPLAAAGPAKPAQLTVEEDPVPVSWRREDAVRHLMTHVYDAKVMPRGSRARDAVFDLIEALCSLPASADPGDPGPARG